ncbi:MAG: hypothetical protein PVG84_01345, partial [Desulfobacterales bacterium]
VPTKAITVPVTTKRKPLQPKPLFDFFSAVIKPPLFSLGLYQEAGQGRRISASLAYPAKLKILNF